MSDMDDILDRVEKVRVAALAGRIRDVAHEWARLALWDIPLLAAEVERLQNENAELSFAMSDLGRQVVLAGLRAQEAEQRYEDFLGEMGGTGSPPAFP